MAKVIRIEKNYLIIGFFILFISIYLLYIYVQSLKNCKTNCNNGYMDVNFGSEEDLNETYHSDLATESKKIDGMQNIDAQKIHLDNPIYINNQVGVNTGYGSGTGYGESSSMVIDERSLNSLDRIYNPLRYPYKSDYYYERGYYPNLEIPFQVVGCGGRRTPCLGGTQVPIYNPPMSIDISEKNIAPTYISTRGPLGKNQQLGVLYKVYGDENDVLPLYGRRKYPNDSKYEYYTLMGRYGVKLPLIIKNKNDELGTNDIVFVKGLSAPYRVTIYESDYPSYIPY